ncbi:MAG: DNA-J related domain-containing protein [Marinobacter sp.]
MINTSTPKKPSAIASLGDPRPHEALQSHIAHLQVALEHELRQAPGGLSEYALIKKLQQPPWQLLGDVRFDQPELLYPIHFLLFHTLYTLRDQLAEDGETLAISAMLTRLESRPEELGHKLSNQSLPAQADSLRAFYLDLNQYQLSTAQIHAMLDNFYAGHRGANDHHDTSEIAAAAHCLGYSDRRLPDYFHEVKQRFRRAVMQAHPDRGGSTEQIQTLNAAFAVIRNHYRGRY